MEGLSGSTSIVDTHMRKIKLKCTVEIIFYQELQIQITTGSRKLTQMITACALAWCGLQYTGGPMPCLKETAFQL